jgi:hypothetical protein
MLDNMVMVVIQYRQLNVAIVQEYQIIKRNMRTTTIHATAHAQCSDNQPSVPYHADPYSSP